MAVKGKAVAKAVTTPKVQTELVTAYQSVLDEQLSIFQESLKTEAAAFEAQKAEELANWKKELARVIDEDKYQFDKAKRDRGDKLELEIAGRVEAVATREVKVKEREVAVGDAEATIAKLQKAVDDIPAIAAKAEAVGAGKGFAEAKKEADAEARIKDAETNAKVQILNNQIGTLTATNAAQVSTIESLKAELAAANLRVQEIANNAVTSAGQSKVTVQNAPASNGR